MDYSKIIITLSLLSPLVVIILALLIQNTLILSEDSPNNLIECRMAAMFYTANAVVIKISSSMVLFHIAKIVKCQDRMVVELMICSTEETWPISITILGDSVIK